jgi:hypothetical protein
MAVHALYCGRCGAPIAPGAVYCGRCGATQLAAAVAAPPAAPPAAYGYRIAQPGVFPGAGRARVPQAMVVGGLLLILAVAVVAVTAFAVSRVIGTHPTCSANCGPKQIAPLPEANTYHSSAFGFEVDYSSNWTVLSQDAGGVSLKTSYGVLEVVGSKSGQSTAQLIDNRLAALPSSKWQSVTRVTDLKGAHIGDQDGQGAIYSANLIGSGATATKVRFAVIAATRGGVSVVIFALDPAAPQDFTNGIPEGEAFDYLCQEFRW